MHELFVATYQKLENYTMYEFLPQGGNMDAGVAWGNAMETSSGGKLK